VCVPLPLSLLAGCRVHNSAGGVVWYFAPFSFLCRPDPPVVIISLYWCRGAVLRVPGLCSVRLLPAFLASEAIR